jgi:tRNA(Arg) A34 adenosine deaminase TadA
MQPDPKIMRLLIQLASENHQAGDHAVAAAIIRDDEIISTGVTTIKRDNDPTAHAETNAIRSAAHLLAVQFLDGCYLKDTISIRA